MENEKKVKVTEKEIIKKMNDERDHLINVVRDMDPAVPDYGTYLERLQKLTDICNASKKKKSEKSWVGPVVSGLIKGACALGGIALCYYIENKETIIHNRDAKSIAMKSL